MYSDYDPSPPHDVPVLDWGDALPLRWQIQKDDTVRVWPTPTLLSSHGASYVHWLTGSTWAFEPFEAFHVPFPDKTRGLALRQAKPMGMVPLQRNWRRRLTAANSWWPGRLEIRQTELNWEDFEDLLPLWLPDLDKPEHLLHEEFSPGFEIGDEAFHWPELYVELTKSPEFLRRIRDDDFAASMSSFLIQHTILRESDEKEMLVLSDRRYGDMLGAWRRCGESYLDFIYDNGPGEPQPSHFSEIETFLTNAGFVAL